MYEPLCGWTNNLYGATGVIAGAYACVLRVLQGYPNNIAEIIPADYVINNIIVSAWDINKTKKWVSSWFLGVKNFITNLKTIWMEN